MLKTYPGFIDVHVHLRDPGATQKEDFDTGTQSAIAGGFTFIIDMPNNPTPTLSVERLEQKITLAKQKAHCDIGFHYGTDGNNTDSFPSIWGRPDVFGLKIYCNHTTGNLLIQDQHKLERIFSAWESQKPILVHAEGDQLLLVLALAKQFARRLHVCHITLSKEVSAVRQAKKNKQLVTAGVTPHHLFLTDISGKTLGVFGIMKPPLESQQDQDALWEGIHDGTIDIVETDHAPHTKEEKAQNPAPFGVPGLETAVGLLFRAVHEKRLKEEQIIHLLYHHPKTIFAIPDQIKTTIELDPEKPYRMGNHGYKTKCGWSPFDNWEAYGEVEQVVKNGKLLYKNGSFVW